MRLNLRSKAAIASACAVFVLGVAAGALGASAGLRTIEVNYRGITLQVDDQPVPTDSEPFIVVSSGRTMVPARALAEALGATVGWDDATSTVIVRSSRHALTAQEGGLVRYRNPARGFSLSYPSGYNRVQPGLLPGFVLSLMKGVTGLTTFHVHAERLTAPVTSAQYADQVVALIPLVLKGFTVSERKQITAYGADVVEVLGEFQADELSERVVARLFVAGNTGWGLIAAGEKERFAAVEPELRGIMDSFALQP